ncbi:MAG: hypothetical protein MHMPM18_000438 [Marteilia pararefringens]
MSHHTEEQVTSKNDSQLFAKVQEFHIAALEEIIRGYLILLCIAMAFFGTASAKLFEEYNENPFMPILSLVACLILIFVVYDCAMNASQCSQVIGENLERRRIESEAQGDDSNSKSSKCRQTAQKVILKLLECIVIVPILLGALQDKLGETFETLIRLFY